MARLTEVQADWCSLSFPIMGPVPIQTLRFSSWMNRDDGKDFLTLWLRLLIHRL